MNGDQINVIISEVLLAIITEAKRAKMDYVTLSIIENLHTKYATNNAINEGKTILYGRFGNRPYSCVDPKNPKHVCCKECL